MSSIKITALEAENVKRIRAVTMEPSPNGLTVIGGNNNQGKTSILDTIAWALGGDLYKPSKPERDGSTIPPRIKVTLSNGLIVERSGKNSALKVIDPNGQKRGQQLLNSFVEKLALNLPKFLEQSSKEKAATLLKVIGVGDQLHALEREENELYNKRHTIGQIADQKRKFALEMPHYPDAPVEPISAYELIQRQQAILAQNGENQRKRMLADELERRCQQKAEKIDHMESELRILHEEYRLAMEDLATAKKTAAELHDESTAQIEQDLENIEAINVKVRANADRERAEQDASQYALQYDDLSRQIADVRQEKIDLLAGATLPLEGLSVENGELTYKGKMWDGMSGSDQLKVATAIVRSLNPDCGFVLLDKMEQMDLQTMQDFGKWLEEQNLQAIATRVSTGSECTIIIEDGHVAGDVLPEIPAANSNWKAGVF